MSGFLFLGSSAILPTTSFRSYLISGHDFRHQTSERKRPKRKKEKQQKNDDFYDSMIFISFDQSRGPFAPFPTRQFHRVVFAYSTSSTSPPFNDFLTPVISLIRRLVGICFIMLALPGNWWEYVFALSQQWMTDAYPNYKLQRLLTRSKVLRSWTHLGLKVAGLLSRKRGASRFCT